MDGVLAGRNEGLGAWDQGLGWGIIGKVRLQASNQTMVFRSIALLVVAFCGLGTSRAQTLDPEAKFQHLLQEMAAFSPTPCGPSQSQDVDWQAATNMEFRLLSSAADVVAQKLNAAPSSPESPSNRAADALKQLEQMSAEINATWPQENRFHFRIFDLPPALVIRVGIREHERFFVFGIPADSARPSRAWQRVGSNEESSRFSVPPSRIDLYPLNRGRTGNVRFLADMIYSGCAGSIGVGYDAREWDPQGLGSLTQIIKQEGALGLDDKIQGFPQIGKLQTEGPLITLPYCWFSAIDTWDNPSLCAVDAYDLSGDEVKFRSRIYNRPDLVPIAKAIEYAERRDYPAVLGYCVSADLAHRLVRELPPDVGAEDLRVTRTGNGKERVEFGDSRYRFDVERRGDRWVLVAFSSE